MYPRILGKVFTWAKAHGFCGIEFVKRGKQIWVFIRCWENSQIRRVCMSILDRFSSNVNEEVFLLGRIIDAIGPDVRVVSVQGGPQALVEAFVNFLDSGYQWNLIEHPLFDLRLFTRCLPRTASSFFGTLDPYSMTEFIVNMLKGAESRDWMASWPALKKTIISNSLGMPELVDVVVNIVGVWPLIVSYLKETGRKDDGNSLVVWSSPFNFVATVSYPCVLNFWCLEEGDGWVLLSRSALPFEVSCLPHPAWNT